MCLRLFKMNEQKKIKVRIYLSRGEARIESDELDEDCLASLQPSFGCLARDLRDHSRRYGCQNYDIKVIVDSVNSVNP